MKRRVTNAPWSVFLLAVVACTAAPPPTPATGSPAPASTAGASASGSPAEAVSWLPSGTLEPGRYVTATFQPRMALTLGQGWAKPVELRDALAIDNRRLGGSINVAKLNAALDPSDPVGRRTAAVGTSVDEIAAWLQRHPYLQVTAPVPVTLGGARGVAMDVQLKLPANFPQLPYCAQPCLAVLRVSEERTPVDRIGFIAGHKDRLIILDVNGQRVVVDSLVYSAERFEAFMLEAQKVLDSIAFNPSATPTGSPPPPIGPFGPNDPEPTG